MRFAVTLAAIFVGVLLLTWRDAKQSAWTSSTSIPFSSSSQLSAWWGRSPTPGSPSSFGVRTAVLTPLPTARHDGNCSCRHTDYAYMSQAAAVPTYDPNHPIRYAPDPCCRRVAISGHKFGTVLKRKFFNYFPWIEKERFAPGLLLPVEDCGDYRHVALVRNLYSALVSGYLYHKSGRECWLDPYGKPWEHQRNIDWEGVLQRSYRPNPTERLGPYPPRKGRSICRYLSDESVEVGMKVYMAYCRYKCYGGVLPYMKEAARRAAAAAERPGSDEGTKLKQVCLEEASEPRKEEEIFYRLVDFLYPGGHNLTFPGIVEEAEGHGTDHGDTEYRAHLLQLVKRYDAELFGGEFAEMNSYFGCAETAR